MIPLIDETHDIERRSWVEGASNHGHFPIQNLPFGIFSHDLTQRRVGVAIGDWILDLTGLVHTDALPRAITAPCKRDSLNELFALPNEDRLALRRRLSLLLSDPAHIGLVQPYLRRADESMLHLPFEIGDYTDFYVGIYHATNVGKLFRPDNPLLPNYKYVPIGYHGRSSSIQLSGVPVRRPQGQFLAPGQVKPSFGPVRRLDYELELGLWIAQGNQQGEPIPLAKAWDHMAGLTLLNDWSARDLQAWEYQPLGPFLAKNFHTTVSPWVMTVEALAPFRRPPLPRPAADPEPLAYLTDPGDVRYGGLALDLNVFLSTERMRGEGLAPFQLSHGNSSCMYWTLAQILTHHASNGCNLRTGDLLGTGTLSAPDDAGHGSLLELSLGGTKPVVLPNGEARTFLEDGDEVIFSGTANAQGYASIGFGDCRARITGSPIG